MKDPKATYLLYRTAGRWHVTLCATGDDHRVPIERMGYATRVTSDAPSTCGMPTDAEVTRVAWACEMSVHATLRMMGLPVPAGPDVQTRSVLRVGF